jgi:hypothetical protein
MAKAGKLYERAMAFTDEVAGPGYSYAREALRRVHRSTFADLPLLDAEFEGRMLRVLAEMHPEKVRVLGTNSTRALIEYGRTFPANLGVAPERGAALCVGLLFALGHGFGNDPLLPWISRTINDPMIVSPEARLKRLHSRVMTYLRHIVAGFPLSGVGP